MTADLDRAGVALTQALRDIPDPPCDLRASRTELRRRTRRVTVRRRLALSTAVIAAAVLILTVLQGLPHADRSLPPAKHLPSGLPIGTPTGRLHTQFRTPEGTVRPLFFRLVVRPDGRAPMTSTMRGAVRPTRPGRSGTSEVSQAESRSNDTAWSAPRTTLNFPLNSPLAPNR
jgi:hypothetical protein